jgi:FkbM family methyltransferase
MSQKNDLVYDIGMNNGDDTAFYLACGFRVVAVDADPHLAALAAKRFKAELEAGRLTILNVGIADQEIPAEFWINEVRPEWNSFSRELTARRGEPHHSILIPCRRIDTIIAEHDMPLYMKIDIEGNDIICCNHLSIATKPEYISVEMSYIELLIKLRDLGYDRFKLVSQVDLRPIGIENRKAHMRFLWFIYRQANCRKEDRRWWMRARRVGAAALLNVAHSFGLWGTTKIKSGWQPNWQFNEGCSGTFGEDLPGEWLTWEETAYIWFRGMKQHKDDGIDKTGSDFWCDLHARAASPPTAG